MSLPASDIAYQEAHSGDDDTTYIIVASAIPLVIAYIAVTLRIVARRTVAIKLQVDDYLVVVGLVC